MAKLSKNTSLRKKVDSVKNIECTNKAYSTANICLYFRIVFYIVLAFIFGVVADTVGQFSIASPENLQAATSSRASAPIDGGAEGGLPYDVSGTANGQPVSGNVGELLTPVMPADSAQNVPLNIPTLAPAFTFTLDDVTPSQITLGQTPSSTSVALPINFLTSTGLSGTYPLTVSVSAPGLVSKTKDISVVVNQPATPLP